MSGRIMKFGSFEESIQLNEAKSVEYTKEWPENWKDMEEWKILRDIYGTTEMTTPREKANLTITLKNRKYPTGVVLQKSGYIRHKITGSGGGFIKDRIGSLKEMLVYLINACRKDTERIMLDGSGLTEEQIDYIASISKSKTKWNAKTKSVDFDGSVTVKDTDELYNTFKIGKVKNEFVLHLHKGKNLENINLPESIGNLFSIQGEDVEDSYMPKPIDSLKGLDKKYKCALCIYPRILDNFNDIPITIKSVKYLGERRGTINIDPWNMLKILEVYEDKKNDKRGIRDLLEKYILFHIEEYMKLDGNKGGEAVMIYKDVYKHDLFRPSIEKQLSLLPKEIADAFRNDLDLVGDLSDLGF